MLPTTGFFKDIDCPYYETTCARPYCHFRHRKRSQEPAEEPPQAAGKAAEIPTYKPTPKSELANTRSHIPISYVPELVVRSDRSARPVIPSFNLLDRPTYKPTPISILSSTNVSKQCEYTPMSITRDGSTEDINLEDLSTEFDMIDEILEDSETETSRKEKSKTKKEDSSNSSKTKSRSKDKKPKEKESSKSHESDKKKEQEKDKVKVVKKDEKKERDERHRKDKYSRSSKSKHKEKDKAPEHKSSKSEHKDKSKERSKDHHSSDKDKHRDKKKHDSKGKKSKIKPEKLKKKESKKKVPPPIIPNSDCEDAEVCFSDDDEVEEDTIEEECYKIFNEYKPPVIERKPERPPAVEPEPLAPEPHAAMKKRVAYDNANQSKISYNRPKHVTNVAVTMTHRIKVARQAQADNEQRGLIAELNRQSMKRPATDTDRAPRKSQKLSVNGKSTSKPAKEVQKPTVSASPKTISLVDDILSGKAVTTIVKPMRIAPATNVNSIQRAKARLDEMVRNKAAQVLKTTAQTSGKGAKRVAHVPDASLSDLPDVLSADKSKLPVNVRTRYLTMLADECVKLYVSKEDAFQRALSDEFKCYEKCSVLTTYRNSAMLAVNRLRKEILERESSGRGPIQFGEETNKSNNPLLQGKSFYDRVSGYVLTEDELVMHGYPREGPAHGRAIISSELRPVTSEHLEDNQRVCCRCHKLYLVDDVGFALVEEECIYHPLRKRTLRGERTYLCCKSTDDIGCAMSNTHVSEESVERELEGYQSTMDPEYDDDPRSCAVYALDCEMCYTTKGLELTRVTVVDTNMKTVYESFVQPLNPIIDYNTRFSGITKEQMDRTSTSILQVQANILHLCNSRTILIGHSLESDMKALKIIHSTVIDTSVMFPHKFGLPHKRALRVLASEYLKKIIQNDVAGHDSAEDALACMELVLWKVKEDMKVKGVKC